MPWEEVVPWCIRGTQGEWLFGFANFGSPGDSIHVELWALKIGTQHTWKVQV